MNIKNAPFVAATVLLTLTASVKADTNAATTPGTSKKPNILFIACDDLRPELGCYGKDYIHSPNIDGLAKKGMVFDRAYVQQAVCSPSRTSLITGTRPDTTKVWDLVTHFRTTFPNVTTLMQNFKNNGYFVQGMGKIFHGSLNDEASWSVPWQVPKAEVYALPEDAARVGKNENVQGEPDGTKGNNAGAEPSTYSTPGVDSNAVATTTPPTTDKKGKKKKGKAGDATAGGGDEGGKYNIRGPIYECADVPDNTFTDGKVADLAVKTLQELAKKDQPFFLAVGFIKPHLPWVSPKKYWDMYDPAQIALAPNQFLPVDAPEYAVNPQDGEFRAYKGVPPTGRVPDEVQHKLKQAYFAGISYTDAQIGKVLDELKKLGLDKNTIVILWGDHGWKLGEHSTWGKHTNVENDVNAPLIISVPEMKNAGQHSKALVEHVDIYPTLSELAGLPLPSHLEGTSFAPLLDHPDQPWKTAAFSQYPRPKGKGTDVPLMGYSMRTDRYRFTVWVARDDHSKINAIELYDHQTDPQENTNIAKKAENADLVKKLMDQWNKGWQGAKPSAKVPASAS